MIFRMQNTKAARHFRGANGDYIRSVLFFILCLTIGCTTNTRKNIQDSETSIERTTEKGPVQLTVQISPSAPRLSDIVEMAIIVATESDVEIKPPSFGQAVGDFLIRDYSEVSDTIEESDRATRPIVRKFRYRLEPVHAGKHLIRAIAIEFIDSRPASENRGKTATIESEPIEVEITSELGDKIPNLADLAPMEAPQSLARSTASNWLWLAVPIALLALSLAWFLRRRTAAVVETIVFSPSEIAHTALAALLAEDLPSKNRFQEFYLRLTGIVRNYIEGTTGVRAPEQTTEEFLRAMRLRNLFQAEQSNRLKEFLEAADMVKFAGQQPGSEQIELSIGRAREFVDMQTPVFLPSSPIGAN